MEYRIQVISNLLEIKHALSRDDIAVEAFGVKNLEHWLPDIIGTIWIQWYEDEKLVGVAAIKQFSDTCITFHAGVYKEFRNKDSHIRLLHCLHNLKSIIPFNIVLCPTKKSNVAANRALQAADFTISGYIPGGYTDSDMRIYTREIN